MEMTLNTIIVVVCLILAGTLYGWVLNIKVTGWLIRKKKRVPLWLQKLGYRVEHRGDAFYQIHIYGYDGHNVPEGESEHAAER